MIVVVTGPSAAGKTTWCRRHFPDDTVPEHVPGPGEAPGPDPEDQAAFWCEAGTRRWRQAERHERHSGLAVCDDDPLKLHYAWSLARIGALSRRHWQAGADAHREAVAAGRLGFADLVLVSAPPEDELRRRRDADPARRRRHFDLHVRLAEPLRQWYQAVERVGAAPVVWSCPPPACPPSCRRRGHTDATPTPSTPSWRPCQHREQVDESRYGRVVPTPESIGSSRS